MLSENEFLQLVRDELRLPLDATSALVTAPVTAPAATAAATAPDLDVAVHWDSLLVLRLVAAVERRTGQRVAVGRLVRQRNLQSIYDTFVAG